VQTIYDRLDALEKSVGALQSDAKNFAYLSSVSSAINYLNSQISELKDDIDTLNARVTSLEQRI
jgi:peptidoglycan hydrolase CwlO-like protein